MIVFVSFFLSVLFAFLSDGPVFDGKIHFEDIFHYITNGVSLETVQAQTNPQAPGVYLFLTMLSKIIGSSVLGFRLVILSLWGLIFWILNSHQLIKDKKIGALLAIALATHSYFGLTSGTIMTEVFALLCSLLAFYYLQRDIWFGTLLSGIYLTFAFYCRQYYLAVIGAFLITLFLENPKNLRWFLLSLFPFLGIVLLFSIWGGLVPPVVRKVGIPYSGLGTSLGINATRPLSAIFYVGLYMVPFLNWKLFLTELKIKKNSTLICFVIGFSLACLSTYLLDSILASGPIFSLLKVFNSSPFLYKILFFLLSLLSQITFFYGLGMALPRILNKKVSRLESISFFVIVLYVLEQFGIKGNLPHFERYTLQVYFFSTYLLIKMNPKLSWQRAALLGLTFIFSQYLLWKQFLST